MSLELRPCDFQTASKFVGEHHRHNKPPVGHKYSIACYDGDRLCGVCMVGRPIGRYLDEWYDPSADLELCHIIDILDDTSVTPTIVEAEEGE